MKEINYLKKRLKNSMQHLTIEKAKNKYYPKQAFNKVFYV